MLIIIYWLLNNSENNNLNILWINVKVYENNILYKI
jgi:hypothetical protein